MSHIYRCAWFLLIVLLGHSAHALQLTDDRGVTIHLPSAPKRIVSLLPSLTETVCELGHCQRLVGVDRYSNFPASLQKLPQVGGGLKAMPMCSV
jgi:iron complex transport system substrate-binding protein